MGLVVNMTGAGRGAAGGDSYNVKGYGAVGDYYNNKGYGAGGDNKHKKPWSLW